MENLFYNLSQVLGITIIHSLWQGLTVYVALSMILQFFPEMQASSKYKLAFAALSVVLVWFGYTLYIEIDGYSWLSTVPAPPSLAVTALVPVDIEQWPTPTERYYFVIAGYLPYITMLYLGGLVFNTLKMLLAWNNIYRIRQNIIPADFQEQLSQLAHKTGVKKLVKVALSELIDVPCITGFLKPIILLPCTISSYLSAEEIQAILLHELAHIKRNDYLLNLLQQAINTLLFFNPFSTLIGRIINRERENSCDDLVVRTTNTPLVYAQALLKLEQNQPRQLQLALAATGKKYHLLHRIERIMKTQKTTVNIRPALAALVLLVCSISSIAWFNPKIEQGKISVKAINNPLTNMDLYADTFRAQAKPRKLIKPKPIVKPNVKSKTNEYAEDPKMKELTDEIEKHAKAIEQYYHGADFTQMQAAIEKKSKEMESLYNDPDLKHLEEALSKKSIEFAKLSENPDMKKLQAEIEASSKRIGEYYNTPEYAKQQKNIEKESQLLAKSKEGSPEYQQHLEAIVKLSADIKDYAKNPAIQEQIELAKKIGMQMQDYYNSPEFAKQRDELKAYGDSISKAYQNPKMKEQQKMMRELNKSIQKYQNKPEIQHEKKKLKDAEEKLREYQKSPEYKKKQLESNIDSKMLINNVIAKEVAEVKKAAATKERIAPPQRVEKPERTERPEPIEKVEPMEKTERPEPKEPKIKIDTAAVKERKPAPKQPKVPAIPKSDRITEITANNIFDNDYALKVVNTGNNNYKVVVLATRKADK